MRRCLSGLALVVITSSCARPAEEPTRALVTASAKTDVTERLPAALPAQYVVKVPGRARPNGRFELGKDRTGIIFRGARVIVDPRGAPVSEGNDSILFTRAEELDGGAGTGFLFHSSQGLFRAETFDGPLTQLSLEDVSTTSQGPGFVLATLMNGATRVVDLGGGKSSARVPLGTVLVRTAADGTAAALAHGGFAYVSRDRGRTWTDVTAAVGGPRNLEVADGILYILTTNGEAVRVDAKGLSPAPIPGPTVAASDPDWNKAETPLEYAVGRGAVLEDGRAIAVDGGTVVEVSLANGEMVAREQGALPPQGACVPASVGSNVLFFCSQNDTSSVFARSKRGGPTKLEKSFETHGSFHRGRGDTLLFAGPCGDTTVKPGVACIRSREGQWTEVDRSGELSDAPATEPLRPFGWIPKDGGAYLLVAGKGGGIWDAKSGTKARLDEDAIKKLEPLFQVASSRLIDRFAVSSNGDIVGLSRDNVGFRVVDAGKRIERSPFRMSTVSGAGSRVLASDSATNTIWQSSDWGFTYKEVDGPPGPVGSRDTPRACTEVGCVFSNWVRIGWEERPPTPKGPQKAIAAFTPESTPELPQLKCTVTGPLTRKEVVRGDQRLGLGAETHKEGAGVYLALFSRSVQHPMLGAVESLNLRAAVTGKTVVEGSSPAASIRSQSRRVRFVEPFDPKGTVRDASIKLGDLFDAARSTGAPGPDLAVTDDRGIAIQPLSDPPSVLLSFGIPGPMLWARGKDKPIPVGAVDDQVTPISAVQTGPEELALLVVSWEGGSIVRGIGRGRSNELFRIPPLPEPTPAYPSDALAVGPDGKLAVVRLTTTTPPTEDAPALLLRPAQAPIALAPWSKLEVDGAPACDAMRGYRVILQLRQPWITPGGGASWDREIPSFLRVRWSATQLCLEAAEVHFTAQPSELGSGLDSYIVARFGDKPEAGHVMVAEGVELREPRSCELVR